MEKNVDFENRCSRTGGRIYGYSDSYDRKNFEEGIFSSSETKDSKRKKFGGGNYSGRERNICQAKLFTISTNENILNFIEDSGTVNRCYIIHSSCAYKNMRRRYFRSIQEVNVIKIILV